MEKKQTKTEQEIEQAKAILKQHGYYVDSLWSINYPVILANSDWENISEEESYEILRSTFTNESVISVIHNYIYNTVNKK